MKALTVYQPWASAIALGHKRFETRSWRPPAHLIGQEIAIHAASKWTLDLVRKMHTPAFSRVLHESRGHLPRGAVLCTARILRVESTNAFWPLSGSELALGDYSANRFAWELRVTEVFDHPIPCKGAQRLWEWIP